MNTEQPDIVNAIILLSENGQYSCLEILYVFRQHDFMMMIALIRKLRKRERYFTARIKILRGGINT